MKKEENSIYNYSWKAFEADVKVLLKKIDFSNYDILIGVAKGGLPLLVKLANKTEKKYIIVECHSYKGKVRERVNIKKFDNLSRRVVEKKRILLIDDVADSGKTLEAWTEWLEWLGASVETLTLFYKPQSVVVPEWYLHEVENHQWIKFPWE